MAVIPDGFRFPQRADGDGALAEDGYPDWNVLILDRQSGKANHLRMPGNATEEVEHSQADATPDELAKFNEGDGANYNTMIHVSDGRQNIYFHIGRIDAKSVTPEPAPTTDKPDDSASGSESGGDFEPERNHMTTFATPRTITNMQADPRVTALSAAIRFGLGVPLDTEDQAALRKHGGSGITSLHAVATAALQIEGRSIPFGGPDELLSAAISTASFPAALSDSFNKSVFAGYQSVPRVFLDIFGRVRAKNFHEGKAIKLSSFSRPGDVTGGGRELPYATFSESHEPYQLNTKGSIFALTRQMWINDDLGIFAAVPFAMGKAMIDEFEQIGCDLLVSNLGVGPTLNEDGLALFSEARTPANYITGAGSALSQSSFSAASTKLMSMKHGERYVSVMPKWCLVPPDLFNTAQRLLNSDALVAGGSNASTELEGASNPFKGIATPVQSPRLLLATNGTTAWYLIGDQKQVPSLAAVTLNGREEPIVEEVALPGNVLGRGWRCYLDMGWCATDWRSIIRNKGA